ncbi:conserved hypothetical protein [Syntrophobacter sp. SbD1]|nr:conserved hypothetical protein [Syntrophobacter sp. SbD1]
MKWTAKEAEVIRYFQERHGGPGDDAEALPYRLTSCGAWAASRPEHLFNFFKRVDLSRFRLFIDLGSGDGVACCTAGLFTRSIGIEADPFLVSRAAHAALDLKLQDRVGFICADFLTQRIQEADCLFVYPDKPVDAIEKSLQGWSGTLLIYGPHFPPKRFSPVEKLKYGRETLTVYSAEAGSEE